MNLNDYFDPVSLEKPTHHILDNPSAFCRNIAIHTPQFPIHDLDQYKVAIIGVPEDRNSINTGSSQAPDKIRNKLYQLIRTGFKFKIIDLGNMKVGKNHDDTIYGLRDIVNRTYHDWILYVSSWGVPTSSPTPHAWFGKNCRKDII